MSLIETAIVKAKELAGATAPESVIERRRGTQGAAGSSTQSREPAMPVRAPMPRVVQTPQLIITEALLREHALRPQPEQEKQTLAEYRHIKRGLLAEIKSGTANRMMVIASALQGEGKSYSSLNLALSLAREPDYTVLLVDADVIKPQLSKVFGLTGHPGLMDAAADTEVDVESLIVTTNIEGLSILPAGRADPNATEYFASARMHAIVDQLLRVPNRLIVADSLPLLLTTESRALAPLAGQVLLVVRAEATPQVCVLQALELLGEGVNVKLMLNAVVRTRVLEYFGDGYGYGYGYTYNYGDSSARSATQGEKQ